MAGIKISDLPAVAAPALTDVFPIDQGAVTYKETAQQLLTLFQANIVIGPSNFSGVLTVDKGGTGIATTTPYSIIAAGTTATGSFQSLASLGSAGQILTSNGAGALPTWQASTAVTPAALTRVDDTNVTITLGGTPATALLQATSLTMGWSGQLSLARGGTNKNITADNGGIVYCDADSFELLAATATAGKIIRSGSNAAPSWSTATYPSASGANGNLLTSDGTNWISSAPASTSPLTTKGDIYTFTTVNARLAVGTVNGQILQVSSGDATGLAWSVPTYPAASGTSGKFLISDGTNNVYSTSTVPTSAGATANKVLLSDGTNYVLSTPAFPNASATSGKIIISDGTNWIASTPTYPSAAGTSGNILTSDGTNWTSAANAASGLSSLSYLLMGG